MKRIIFLMLLGIFISFGAQAQFSFGVKGGLTVSDINYDLLPDTAADPLFNYHAGVFFKFGEGMFGFQPEILYVRKGCEVNDKESDYFQKYRLNYMEVPLLARAGLNLKMAELYFYMGPYVGYGFGGKLEERTFNPESNTWEINSDSYSFDGEIYEQFDAGIIMGAGVRVLMVIFEVRFNKGLIYTASRDKYDDSTHKYLSISMGVQF